MVTSERSSRTVAGAAVLGWLGVLTLAGCADDGAGTAQTAGSSVAAGAPRADYRAALADIESIVIRAQTPGPKGSASGARFEDYMAAVEEWSGGKVTFDIAYSNAVAAPADVDNALADGRLDLGSVVPASEPQEYPAYTAFQSTTFQGPNGPVVGTMVSNAWWLDVTYSTAEIRQEAEGHGLRYLAPAFNSGQATLMCAEPRTSLDDLRGAQIVVTNQAQVTAVESWGAAPASVAFTEIFEALQRGIADCSLNSLLVAELGGFTAEVPNITSSEDAGFGAGAGAWVVSAAAWDSYPLVVQQLLFDRLDVFLSTLFDSVWQTIEAVVRDAQAAGGEVGSFERDVVARLQGTHDELLDQVRTGEALTDGDAFLSRVQDAIDRWTGVVTDDLGLQEVSYGDFPDFYAPGRIDVAPLVDRLVDDVLLPHRPS